MTWHRLAATTLLTGALLTGCTHGAQPAPDPSATPDPVVTASAAPTRPAPAVTTQPGPQALRDGLTTPGGTALVGAISTGTTGTITTWSATLRVEPTTSAQTALDGLATQLTTVGMTLTVQPGHIAAEQAVPEPAGTTRADVVALEATETDPAYLYITMTHDPEPTS